MFAPKRIGPDIAIDNDSVIFEILKTHAKEIFSRTRPDRKKKGGYYDQIWDEDFTLHKLFNEEVECVFSTHEDLEEELEM